MTSDQLEQKVENHSKEIQALAVAMTEVTTIVKHAEKRHEQDLNTIKDAIGGVKEINDKMSIMVSIQKDIENLKENQAEIKSDVRVNKHDIGNINSAIASLPIFQKAISNLEAKVDGLEKSKSKWDDADARASLALNKVENIEKEKQQVTNQVVGAAKAGRAFWFTVAAIAAGIGFCIDIFLKLFR